jgi:hypothetical protein
MTIMELIIAYVVPVVAGVFILIFISIFAYIIHRAVLKPLDVYGKIKNLMITIRKKKILSNEKTIEYCVKRIEIGWTEARVREELLLANKYSKKRIDEVIFAFNTIKKEMQGEGSKKPVAEDLP